MKNPKIGMKVIVNSRTSCWSGEEVEIVQVSGQRVTVKNRFGFERTFLSKSLTPSDTTSFCDSIDFSFFGTDNKLSSIAFLYFHDAHEDDHPKSIEDFFHNFDVGCPDAVSIKKKEIIEIIEREIESYEGIFILYGKKLVSIKRISSFIATEV